eukprot:gene7896-biopygen10599
MRDPRACARVCVRARARGGGGRGRCARAGARACSAALPNQEPSDGGGGTAQASKGADTFGGRTAAAGTPGGGGAGRWRGRVAGCGHFLAWVARAWRGRGAGISCSPWIPGTPRGSAQFRIRVPAQTRGV